MSPYFPHQAPKWAETVEAMSGSAFPTGDTTDGRIFYRTDVGMWCQYVSAISKWLGPQESIKFGNNTTAINNIYMRGIASIIPSAGTDFGYLIPYDIVITGFTAKWTTGVTSGTWRVRRSGTNNTAISHPGGTVDEVTDMGLGTAFASGGLMQVYADTFNTTINRPTCIVFYRRDVS